jgi:trimeric autotransporter adhesin
MRGQARRWVVAVGILMGGGLAACAQAPAQPKTGQPAAVSDPSAQAPAQSSEPALGGKLHGLVKSGNTPLPGVTVTAQNTLTGKRYSTTTDINGAWSLTIHLNGRYVVRTQFAAFAQGSAEALLNAASHDQAINLDLMLASRAEQQQGDQQAQGMPSRPFDRL